MVIVDLQIKRICFLIRFPRHLQQGDRLIQFRHPPFIRGYKILQNHYLSLAIFCTL